MFLLCTKLYLLGDTCLLVGFHRCLPQDETELRAAGAKLNPRVVAGPSKPPPAYTPSDAVAPQAKTDQWSTQAAQESDIACEASIRKDKHPLQLTGVHASHPFHKAPGWDDGMSRSADLMHNGSDEVKSICVMAQGGTGKGGGIYSVARLPEVAEWEIKINHRFVDVLSPYLNGESNSYCMQVKTSNCTYGH